MGRMSFCPLPEVLLHGSKARRPLNKFRVRTTLASLLYAVMCIHQMKVAFLVGEIRPSRQGWRDGSNAFETPSFVAPEGTGEATPNTLIFLAMHMVSLV